MSTARVFVKSTLPLILVADLSSVIFKRKIKRLYRLVRYGFLVLLMKHAERGGSHLLLGTTFIASLVLKCFSWQMSLYLLIRQLFYYYKVKFLLKPANVFMLHLVHNYLLTFKAELVEPTYLSLWTGTLPYYKKEGYKKWVEEFNSNSKVYLPQQTSKKRLRRLPENILQSCRAQFPLVVALYGLPFIFSLRSKRTSTYIMNKFKDTIKRIIRTSILLALLPYTLCAFPSIYQNIILPFFNIDTNNETRRNPIIHVGFASLLSTWVFLQEPEGRLRMMLSYTLWRILEAPLRKAQFLQKSNGKHTLAATLITATASIS